MVRSRPRRFARKSQRGATVILVVLTTTLIAAIGVFAVRNAAQVDLAVGYSRQAAQTAAISELGTTAALAQVAIKGAHDYADKMNKNHICASNPPQSELLTGELKDTTPTCYPLGLGELQQSTAATLFEKPVSASGETGSFGPFADVQGGVEVELTAMSPTNTPLRGVKQGDGSYFDVTMTTTGNIRAASGADECVGNTARATVKKMMRAHAIIGPLAPSSN